MNVLDLVRRELARIACEADAAAGSGTPRERRRRDRAVARRIAAYLRAENQVLLPALSAIAQANGPELLRYRHQLDRRVADVAARIHTGDALAHAATLKLCQEMRRYGACLSDRLLPPLGAALGTRELDMLGGRMLLSLAAARHSEDAEPAPRRALLPWRFSQASRPVRMRVDDDGYPVLGDSSVLVPAGRAPSSKLARFVSDLRGLRGAMMMPVLVVAACAAPGPVPHALRGAAAPAPASAPEALPAAPAVSVIQGNAWTPAMVQMQSAIQQAALSDGRVSVVRTADNQLAVRVDAGVAMNTKGDGLRQRFGRFMDALAAALADHPEVQMRVIGYGDTGRTTAAAHQPLDWAVSAMRYLVAHGVGMERMTVRMRKDVEPFPNTPSFPGGQDRGLEFVVSDSRI